MIFHPYHEKLQPRWATLEQQSAFLFQRSCILSLGVIYYFQFRSDLFTYPNKFPNQVPVFRLLPPQFPHTQILPSTRKTEYKAMLSIKSSSGWRKRWFNNISMLDIQLIFLAVIGFSTGMCHCKNFTNIYQNHSVISKTKRMVIYPTHCPFTNKMLRASVNHEV